MTEEDKSICVCAYMIDNKHDGSDIWIVAHLFCGHAYSIVDNYFLNSMGRPQRPTSKTDNGE